MDLPPDDKKFLKASLTHKAKAVTFTVAIENTYKSMQLEEVEDEVDETDAMYAYFRGMNIGNMEEESL